MTYLQLFLSFIQIGLFSFGGGYAAIPLIQDQVVSIHGWLSMKEFTDLITISQMTPGPIAVNSATFVGIKIAGIPGALTASRLYSTVLHHRYDYRQIVPEIPGYGGASKCPLLPSSGCGLPDRLRRDLDSDHRDLAGRSSPV